MRRPCTAASGGGGGRRPSGRHLQRAAGHVSPHPRSTSATAAGAHEQATPPRLGGLSAAPLRAISACVQMPASMPSLQSEPSSGIREENHCVELLTRDTGLVECPNACALSAFYSTVHHVCLRKPQARATTLLAAALGASCTTAASAPLGIWAAGQHRGHRRARSGGSPVLPPERAFGAAACRRSPPPTASPPPFTSAPCLPLSSASAAA